MTFTYTQQWLSIASIARLTRLEAKREKQRDARAAPTVFRGSRPPDE